MIYLFIWLSFLPLLCEFCHNFKLYSSFLQAHPIAYSPKGAIIGQLNISLGKIHN